MSNTVFLKSVGEYIDKVLAGASDRYREPASPLLADFIDVEKGEPMHSTSLQDGADVVVSDLAHQQNFLRLLTLYSELTGDERYEQRAEAIYRYHLDNLTTDAGLFLWGGHCYVDLLTLTRNGEKGIIHELKNDFPDYSLLYRVSPEALERFGKAFWNAHVYNFTDFEMGRHGKEPELPVEGIWERRFGDPAPFQQRAGLSFMNTGNDLMYAALCLYTMCGDKGALLWGTRMHDMYVKCRDPKTGLGVYSFSQALKRMDTDDPTITLSFYGDRAKRQFGPELGEGALEGNMLIEQQCNSIYGMNPQIVALYYESGAEHGAKMLADSVASLKAFAKYAYDAADNHFHPMLADGTDLTNFTPARPGYYGPAKLRRYPASGRFFYAYARIALLANDAELWEMARTIARGNDLGDIGALDGTGAQPNLASVCDDPAAVMALINIHKTNGCAALLDLAEKLAGNIIANTVRNGYYLRTQYYAAHRTIEQSACNIDTQYPLAVLAVAAAREGKADKIPFAVY